MYLKKFFAVFAVCSIFLFEISTVEAAKLGSFEENAQAVEFLNKVRAEVGLKRVKWNSHSKLQAAAELRAKELEKLFSHIRPNGFICFTALKESSVVKYKICAENIAYDKNLSAEGATKLWCNSPCHYEVMTIGDLKEVGLASWHDNNGNVYWVQLFTG